GAGPNLDQSVVLTGLKDSSVDCVVVFPRSPDFHAGFTSHAVAQHAYGFARDGHGSHVEEFEFWWCFAGGVSEHVHGAGALELITIELWGAFPDSRAVVAADFDVVVACFSVVMHPVDGWWDTYGAVFVFGQMEQDVVANNISVIVDCNKLFGLIDGKIFHRVDREVFDQSQCVWTFEVEICHVV